MEYRSMVYRSEKIVPPWKVGLPTFTLLSNFAQVERQQNQGDWQRKVLKNTFYKKSHASNRTFLNLKHTLGPDINGKWGGRITYPSVDTKVRIFSG